MITRYLNKNDKNQLEDLIKEIEEYIDYSEFWIPITDISRKHFFDEKWTNFFGAFENEKLIAAFGIFFNENEYGESQAKLGITQYRCAELGRAMVHPKYRNKGLMKELGKELIECAHKKNIAYLIATAHPKNYASKKSLERLGFIKKDKIVKNGNYRRNIYIYDVKENYVQNRNQRLGTMARFEYIIKSCKNEHKFLFINTMVLILFCVFAGLCEYFSHTKIDVTILIAIIGFIGVITQMYSAKNVSSAGYDLELQNSFINNSGFNELFLYCWNKYIGGKYKNYKNIKDIEDYQTVLFGYFTFFESVYLMYKKGVIKMSLLDDLFGRRFFVVVNCKEVQELDLKKNRDYYENIFKLYKVWKQYRLAHNKTKLTTELNNNKEFTELDK